MMTGLMSVTFTASRKGVAHPHGLVPAGRGTAAVKVGTALLLGRYFTVLACQGCNVSGDRLQVRICAWGVSRDGYTGGF
jgi:hypothetical protein